MKVSGLVVEIPDLENYRNEHHAVLVEENADLFG